MDAILRPVETGPRSGARVTQAPQGVTPQVIIDQEALRALGFLPDLASNRLLADQYRRIKRPIVAQALKPSPAGGELLRLVMMTSSSPRDGKTFTSINLAFSIAQEQDVSVVLVDADVVKQHVSRIFKVGDKPGLLDAVLDANCDVESLILPTNVAGLGILPVGKQHERATELLASMRMRDIAARLASANPRRIALFDSPPLLWSSESRALAQLLGHIVLVVRAGVTPQGAILEAMGCVPEDKPIGLVLNGGEAERTEGYYGG
jgi:protein-tyrosine kinase